MKNIGISTLALLMITFLLQACGPSEAEKKAAEQARLDSLRAVQEREIAEQMAAYQDSLDRAEAAALITEDTETVTMGGDVNFSEGGNYIVQVGAFRSEDKANRFLNGWADRNYPHSYVVKIGDEESGDVWFRLRVGYFDNADEAAKLGNQLADEINSDYWVSLIDRS